MCVFVFLVLFKKKFCYYYFLKFACLFSKELEEEDMKLKECGGGEDLGGRETMIRI